MQSIFNLAGTTRWRSIKSRNLSQNLAPYSSDSNWFVGLVVWFSFWVREIRGSNPGRALFIASTIDVFICFIACNAQHVPTCIDKTFHLKVACVDVSAHLHLSDKQCSSDFSIRNLFSKNKTAICQKSSNKHQFEIVIVPRFMESNFQPSATSQR